MTAVEQVRSLIESRVAAIADKDVEALAGQFAEDVVLFDALGPLRDQGIDVEKARLDSWFGAYRTTIDVRIEELEVAASDGLAFGHYLFHVEGTMHDDTEVSMWVRSTVCCRDTADGWKIVHEHSSVPFSLPGTAAG
jgi:ketosteroid isomerase-like protein